MYTILISIFVIFLWYVLETILAINRTDRIKRGLHNEIDKLLKQYVSKWDTDRILVDNKEVNKTDVSNKLILLYKEYASKEVSLSPLDWLAKKIEIILMLFIKK
jgi:hypothetical protein